MTSFSTTVEITVHLPRERAFLGIVPIDLRKVFPGYGPLPAIIGVSNQVGGWDAVGQTRNPQLSDGSSASEKIIAYRKPEYFSYRVGEFTGFFRFITSSGVGEWWFDAVSDIRTHIRWRYTYHSQNIFLVPVLWFMVHALWRGYMQQSLALTKREIESTGARPGR